MFKIPNFMPPALFDTEDERDVTDLAPSLGVLLPEGYTLRARVTEDDDQSDPRRKGDVYNCDTDEADYDNPTRAFCGHCGAWIYKLDQAGADAIDHERPADADPDDPAYAEARPGMWANLATGVSCTDAEEHEPDAPLAVRDFYEGKWRFVGVMVDVLDPDGEVVGSAALWGTEAGRFPYMIDRETGQVEYKTLDLLREEYPLHELVRDAAGDAADRQERERAAADAAAGPVLRLLRRLTDRWLGRLADPAGEQPRIVIGAGPRPGRDGTVWSAQIHHDPVFRDGTDAYTAGDDGRHCAACGDVLPADLPSTDLCPGPRRTWWGRRR